MVLVVSHPKICIKHGRQGCGHSDSKARGQCQDRASMVEGRCGVSLSLALSLSQRAGKSTYRAGSLVDSSRYIVKARRQSIPEEVVIGTFSLEGDKAWAVSTLV